MDDYTLATKQKILKKILLRTDLTQWFFWWWILAILAKVFWKKNIVSQIPRFFKTIEQKAPKPQLPTIWFFHFHILSRYCQLWLNIFMDDCHLSNVTKLKKNHCPHQAGFGLSWRLACTSCTGKQPLKPQKDALTTNIPLRSDVEVQVSLHTHSAYQVRSAFPSIFKDKTYRWVG